MFTQPFIRVQIKGNIKAPRHWPLWGEFTGDKWPVTRKMFPFDDVIIRIIIPNNHSIWRAVIIVLPCAASCYYVFLKVGVYKEVSMGFPLVMIWFIFKTNHCRFYSIIQHAHTQMMKSLRINTRTKAKTWRIHSSTGKYVAGSSY